MRQFNSLLRQPELSVLIARHEQTEATQNIWKEIAPDNLAQLSHASSIKNQQFTVFADNNAVAAKIKLLTPSLLIKLEKLGCEVTAIRVKVQVKSISLPKPKAPKKLSPEAIKQLQQLVKKLTGTALGETLEKLLKNAD